jgi:predicted SAM-dependent methyltransferase
MPTTQSVTDLLKVELGGGSKPREGYINVDRTATDLEREFQVDFDGPDECDTNELVIPWQLPFDDNSVGSLYSSHCLEHIRELPRLMREIVRICAVGVTVEIIVPHWAGSGANLHGHVQTIPPCQAEHWGGDDQVHLAYWWEGCAKRLKLLETEYVRGRGFHFWREALPAMSEASILEFCPDAAHEIRYVFSVVENR